MNPPDGFGQIADVPGFADRLSALCAMELPHARKDAERMGVMIERLAAALGLTVAVAARGDGETIGRLISGAEAHALEEAVAKTPLAKFLGASA